MSKRIVLVFALVGAFVTTPAFAFFMDFEDGLGNDGGVIAGIDGISFTNSAGLNWMYCDVTTGNYNATSVNTGNSWGTGRYNMYDYVNAWLGTSGNWGRVDFDDQTGTWFEINVSSASDFYLEAYDDGGNLLDFDYVGMCTQWEGWTAPATLRVDAPTGTYISYIIVHDSGNYWCLDNVAGDMYVEDYGGSGGGPGQDEPIPEPASICLLGLGLGGLVLRRTRKNW